MKAEQKSLTDQFITIDALIQQNQMASAVKELQKAEKRVYDVWTYLGVYKRYMYIGENELAEKIIKKAIKDNPKSLELSAVYTNFLLRNNRLDDAEAYGKNLINTEYSSLYSEIVLRKSQNVNNIVQGKKVPKDFDFYKKEDFYNVFLDAYKGSKNPIWLKNCAIFDLINGRYERISFLAPEAYGDADDAFFWALALYDAGKYYECIDAVESSQVFLNDLDSMGGHNKCKTTPIQQTALLSDAYMCVADMEMAEKARQEFIFNIDFNDENPNLELSDPLLPVILTNSAIWAYNQGFEDECADLLFYTVNNWPDFVPGLVLYSDFAYNSNIHRDENSEMTTLREAGLATVEMEQYDSRRKIPLSDAIYRVNGALERTNNPYLSIVQLDLKYKSDKSLNEKDKNRDLWNMLETSYLADEKYKSLLIQYALNSLLKSKEYEDGWRLFKNYVLSVSDFDAERSFWEQFTEKVGFYDLGIVEFGAWFAAASGNLAETLRLLEYCVYESGGILEDGLVSQNVSSATCMNLGDVYYSIGRKDKALDLYGRVAGRESKKSIRSEIYYRIACIYSKTGDIKNALRSAEYACELYPENVRASLLKDKLKIN